MNPAYFVSFLTSPLSLWQRARLALYFLKVNTSRQAVDWFSPFAHVFRDRAGATSATAAVSAVGQALADVMVKPLLRSLLLAEPTGLAPGWVPGLLSCEALTDRVALEGGSDSLCRYLLGLRIPGWRDGDADGAKDGPQSAGAATGGDTNEPGGAASRPSQPVDPTTDIQRDRVSRFPNVRVLLNARVERVARDGGSSALQVHYLSSRAACLACGDGTAQESDLDDCARHVLEVDEVVIATPGPAAATLAATLPKSLVPASVLHLVR